MSHDPRVTLARPSLVARSLEGVTAADGYADSRSMTAVVPAAPLRAAPDANAEQVDQVLFGETFEVLEEAQGFCWGQARRDGYVGYVARADLGPLAPAPTHRVSAIRTYAFREASIKSRALGPYSLGGLIAVEARDGRFVKAANSGWFVEAHLSPIGVFEGDVVEVAERYLGAPYLWGGRESLGLDCSGLVQQALLACGRACPRDTDQQALMGRPVETLARGDLVFWRGHVAIMLDGQRILHANGHHMATAIEPLAEAVARIAATSTGQPTGYRRL
ncbi:NlpC/P60 family protein [Phenylobacterium sp.]|uniref:C40 family peptidase n=1 Tax=Phenylobacterium sp. TaxID=1871053 RepID=UPI002723ADB8|nr:NlpC/P60 family protein [Phenylobacterium sp.]MDO8800499.1 NlpC/P60 family protein [Phenylobacterium sp.]